MRQLWAAALVATAAAFELASFTYSAGEGLITLTFDEAVQSRTLKRERHRAYVERDGGARAHAAV